MLTEDQDLAHGIPTVLSRHVAPGVARLVEHPYGRFQPDRSARLADPVAQLVVLVAKYFWIELAHGVKHSTRPHAGKHAFDVHASMCVGVRGSEAAERTRRSMRDGSVL